MNRGIFNMAALRNKDLFMKQMLDYHPNWTLYAHGLLYSPAHEHLIDDVLQDFYCKAFEKWEFIPKGHVNQASAYLYKMLRNECNNVFRKKQNKEPLCELKEVESHSQNIDHYCFEACESEIRTHLASLLKDLDLKIVLMILEGFKCDEIAADIGQTKNYVEVRLTRLRKKIRIHFN
jgi:RNA polymerase sigma factor (sigma-70 family)